MSPLQRVDDHAGGEFGIEVGAFLGHDFVVAAQFLQRVERGGLEEKSDLVARAVDLGCDFVGVGGVANGGFVARGESGPDDFVEKVAMEDGDV